MNNTVISIAAARLRAIDRGSDPDRLARQLFPFASNGEHDDAVKLATVANERRPGSRPTPRQWMAVIREIANFDGS